MALPGPNDEVKASLPLLLNHLKSNTCNKQDLAESIAANLRQILREKMKHKHYRLTGNNGFVRLLWVSVQNKTPAVLPLIYRWI